MADTFLDTLMQQIGMGGAKAVPTESAAPVVDPSVPEALPNQPMPATAQSAPQEIPASIDPSMVQQPAIQPMQQTTTTQGIAPADKAGLEGSVAKQEGIYNEQTKYIKDLSEYTTQANKQADTSLGSQEDSAKQYVKAVAQGREDIQNQMQQMDDQVAKLRASEFKNFWAEKSTPSKIGMALAVGFGQYAASMTGSQNMAWNILQKAMDDDFRLQQANYDKQLRNIDMMKIGIDQKYKLIDAATKDFEVKKVARASYIEDKVNKQMSSTGQKLTPALQEIMFKTKAAKEAAYQQATMNIVDKTSNQIVSAVPKMPIDHEQAIEELSNEKTPIGKYKQAIDNYTEVETMMKTKNPNAAVIKLIADGLNQNSYNPDQFDTTSRSAFQKLKDRGSQELGEADKMLIVQAARKFFKENAITQYNNVKSSLPTYLKAGMVVSQQQTGKVAPDFYKLIPGNEITQSNQGFSKTGMKADK